MAIALSASFGSSAGNKRPANGLSICRFRIRRLHLVFRQFRASVVSLWVQLDGLVGASAVLPAERSMAAARQQFDQSKAGLDRYHLFPTLCWFGASDRSLTVQCAAGTILSILLLAGIAPAPI